MTTQEWTDELVRRTRINEGLSLTRYLDSLGVPTIGIGYNLSRGVGPLTLACVANPQAVIDGTASITEAEAVALCKNDLAFAVDDARASLIKGIYDSLSDARRYVVADLCYNMGLATWLSFVGTRSLIEVAQQKKEASDVTAHSLFVAAGEHLRSSAYYNQTRDRAKRNVAMLINGDWCNAEGDGSDISQS